MTRQLGVRIAERGNRFAPVIPIEVGPAFLFGDAPAILHQAWAKRA